MEFLKEGRIIKISVYELYQNKKGRILFIPYRCMNANIYGRSQIFETEKRKSRKKIRNKNACRVACIWTCRRYAVGCSGRCTEHDVTVRGFVEQKYLDFSDETKKQIEANGEDKYQTAKETVKPEENQALYYTLTSVKEGSPSGEIRGIHAGICVTVYR